MSDFDDIWDWISGGQVTRNKMEESELSGLRYKLEKRVNSYNKWHRRGIILSKAMYQITITAFSEVCKLHDMINHLSIKQRNIVEHSLQNKNYALKDIERTLSTLKVHSSSWETQQFAKNTLDGGLSIMRELPGKAGLATAGIYTVIQGLEHYANLNNQLAQIKAQQYEMLKSIDKIEEKLFELKMTVHRADERGLGLGKGITAFRYCFDDVNKKLFPKGEESKKEREQRVANGGDYFLENEKPEIESLIACAGYVLKMVEAQP